MTVLVDAARWRWRDDRWAHLVSDESYDELHEFARRLGKRRLGFQGDHYDVASIDRERALALGARSVESRELVRRLRSSGLRNRRTKPEWVEAGRWGPGELPSTLSAMFGLPGQRLDRALEAHGEAAMDSTLAVFHDPAHVVALIELENSYEGQVSVDVDLHVVGEPRVDETSSIELFVRR